MDRFRRRALTSALGSSCALIVVLGLAGLVRTVATPPSAATRTAVEVEDLLVPPHREPPPPPPAAAPPPQDPTAVLAAQIQAALATSGGAVQAASVWIDGYGSVVQQDADRPLVPASTQKLVVAASALALLGNDHSYTTRVIRVGPLTPDGTLQGDLALAGGGDPSFSKGDLDNLASAVAAAGVRRVAGSVIADETRYDRARTAPGWKPSFTIHESGSLSALAVDGNSYRTDPGFIAEPALANADLFKATLAAAGVEVVGPTTLAGGPVDPATEVASKRSPPLGQLVAHMLTESDNFFAEMIVKEIGASFGEPTTAGGLEVMRGFAASRGLPFGNAVDGSGLSSGNLDTADAQIRWLGWIEQSLSPLKAMLPSACQSGTLKRRMCGSAAAGRVTAKSGGLEGVATLAGYTTTASGRSVRFSFFLIGSSSGRSARLAIDAALVQIASFHA